MRSINSFIISPVGKRYNNEKDINGKKLILNTEVYNHEFVNRRANIISCPINGNYDISPGDEVIVHHNVFRRWHNVHGEEKNSQSYYDEDTYIVSEDQIFLYRKINNSSRFKAGRWKAMPGFCFVMPLASEDKFSNEVENQSKGVIVYSDGMFDVNEVVGYDPVSQYEFVIDNQRLYRVYNKFITIKYEREGNEKTYNPSWA